MLPKDVQKAIDDYDRAVANGEITFDAEGFAVTYPRKVETDVQVATLIADHADPYL